MRGPDCSAAALAIGRFVYAMARLPRLWACCFLRRRYGVPRFWEQLHPQQNVCGTCQFMHRASLGLPT